MLYARLNYILYPKKDKVIIIDVKNGKFNENLIVKLSPALLSVQSSGAHNYVIVGSKETKTTFCLYVDDTYKFSFQSHIKRGSTLLYNFVPSYADKPTLNRLYIFKTMNAW